jgi:hypothetical protein
MSIGANIAVVAAGAILAFAVRVHAAGVSVQTVGAVLMAVGVIGLVLQMRALMKQRELTAAQALAPSQAVLVRPAGAPRPLLHAPAPGAGMAAAPLPPEGSPYRYPDEYTGNEW